MGKLKNSYITNAGKTLLFGGGNITYTKAVLYGQDISNLTVPEVKALTIIGQPLMTADVGVTGKTTDGSNSTVNVTATFSNQSLKADLPFGEIGFFAKTDKQDEALIAIVMASPDAYLSAGSPDGTSTDAITVTLAMSIGDANKVDAVVDPAGSVTPASLASAVAKASADLEEAISKKDDITDVDSKLAKKADATDVDKKIADVNQTITADKADSDNKIKQNADAIATKANSSDVYTKTDIDKTIATINSTLGTKITADYSYSKAELDKKFLELGTTTGSKVDADQVADMIAGKADKTAVDADVKSLNDAIATKADKATVDAEIGKIDFTPYAKTADVNSAMQSAMQVVDGNSGDDILSFRDEKIRRYNNVQNVKNLPAMSNMSCFYVITHTKNNWGTVTVISQDNCYWQNALNGGSWNGWVKHATNVDITDLQNQINSKTTGTVVTAYDVASKNLTMVKGSYSHKWLVDQLALSQFADQINQLKGRQTVDAPDFNTLTDTGVYYISNPGKGKNFPNGLQGVLAVFKGSGKGITQIYSADDNIFVRTYWLSSGWRNWNQTAWESNITSLQNQITSLQTQLNDAVNEISYIKDNYVEGRRFPASQEAQATAWESENPQRIAFITDD